MRLLRATRGNFLFFLNDREKGLLLQMLGFYPRVPAAHHQASRGPKTALPEESRQLLDQALAEQRTENRKRVQTFVSDPRRFQKMEEGWRLSLSPAEVEWLLQILNDVNVGSWVVLGSPPAKPKLSDINEKNAANLLVMEIASDFQARLIEAIEGGSEP